MRSKQHHTTPQHFFSKHVTMRMFWLCVFVVSFVASEELRPQAPDSLVVDKNTTSDIVVNFTAADALPQGIPSQEFLNSTNLADLEDAKAEVSIVFTRGEERRGEGRGGKGRKCQHVDLRTATIRVVSSLILLLPPCLLLFNVVVLDTSLEFLSGVRQ